MYVVPVCGATAPLNCMISMDRKIFRLAIPNIITNITVPLLGMIDIAVAGRLGSAVYIGAIALGANIFNMIYWNFGFLRMSSSGFASQAYGARDLSEAMHVLIRTLLIGLGIGTLILLLQVPLGRLAFGLIQSGPESVHHVERYFRMVVWGAPAVLGMKIEGIALGTLLSQIISFLVAAGFWWRYYRRLRFYVRREAIWEKGSIRLYFRVNADVFVRTFLLTLVTTFFTFVSSGMGETILAVNALLMQFFMLFSYFMDGFAYAGEALTGRFIGAGNRDALQRMLRRLFFWGALVSITAMTLYALFPDQILQILTNDLPVIRAAEDYLFWILLIPLTGFAAFLWDGIYIGATASVHMRNAMILSSILFFGSYLIMNPLWGNNGLWLAFILYLFSRGVTQTIWAKRALRL